MSVHRKKSGIWYVSYRDQNGKQRTRSFGRGEEAKRHAQAFDLEIKAKKKLRTLRDTINPGIYLDDLSQAYIKDRKINGVSDRFLKDLVLLLNNKILPFLTHKPVDALTYEDVLVMMEQFKDKSIATRNRYFSYLRAIFLWGIRHGITRNNPLAQWKKTKEPRRKIRLTVEDLQKIYNHASPHLQWAIECEWNLGARPGPSELLSLKWENVDFNKGVVWIYASKTKTWRDIPISEQFRQRLLYKKSMAKSEYIIEYNGRPIKKFRRSFQTACIRAGIKYPCRMYDIRHLFASVMLAGGADLAAVSKLLGHSSTQMTADIYYELLKGEKEKAVSLIPPLEQPTRTDNVIPLIKV